MNGLPYYKAYPRDFVEGTIGMDFELKAAYRLVLDLIYMQGGNLPDDARYISGLLGCTLKKWSSLRAKLVEMGKIEVRGEFLANNRADKELETLGKLQEKQRQNRTHPNKNKTLSTPRFDHTEPDTDTDIRKEVVVEGARAAEKEAATAAVVDLSAREKILKAIGLGLDGATGPSSFIGGMGDMAESEKWNQTGLSLDEQLRVISEVCERQRRRAPQWMPRGFGYFTQAIADLAARKKAPIPAGDPNGQYGGKMSDRDRKMASYQRIKASHGG